MNCDNCQNRYVCWIIQKWERGYLLSNKTKEDLARICGSYKIKSTDNDSAQTPPFRVGSSFLRISMR
jgi:hypothetical protein